jgi:hypothetical protein
MRLEAQRALQKEADVTSPQQKQIDWLWGALIIASK